MTEDSLDRLISAEQDERRRIALFLHDGPVQNLVGDRADARRGDPLDRDRKARRRTPGARVGARAPAGDDSRAARPLVRARACRAARPGLRAGAAARSPTSSATANRIRVDLEVDDAQLARTDRPGRAVHDHPRAARPGDPARPADADLGRRCAQTADGGLETIVGDDAEPERRRRSFEAIEERVKQLHGTIEVEARTTRDAGRRDAAAVRDPAVKIDGKLPPDDDGTGYLLFVWSPAGYTLREEHGDPPRVGDELEKATGRSSSPRSARRRSPATPAPARSRSARAEGEPELERSVADNRRRDVTWFSLRLQPGSGARRVLGRGEAEHERLRQAARVAARRDAARVDARRPEPVDRRAVRARARARARRPGARRSCA